MKTVYFKNGGMEFREKEKPHPREGEAVVKVIMAGICNTDIELLRGYYGFEGIAGHEFIGVVESSPGAEEWVGKRVAADINCGCGKCALCRAGDSRHCAARTVLGIVGRDGAFAEYTSLPIRNLREVPASIPTEAAVFAEPLAAALEPTRQTRLNRDMRVLVLGDGKLGILCALAFRNEVGELTLCGHHERKLGIAGQAGIRTIRSEKGVSLKEYGLEERSFDVVVEATGSPEGSGVAITLTRPEGLVILKTTSRDPSLLDLARVVVDELTLLGSRCGDIGAALEYLGKGLVDPRPMIDAIVPFEKFDKALERACEHGACKILVSFSN